MKFKIFVHNKTKCEMIEIKKNQQSILMNHNHVVPEIWETK